VTAASPSGAGLQAFRVDGQVAVVTGGAQGVGLACAALLNEAGAQVVLLDRDAGALEAARAQVPQARTRVLDVTDEAAVDAAFAAVAAGTSWRWMAVISRSSF
jgi:NAD(P)-dependent dehydrogenase (short-subunit alcohol dehydrogenase family)